MGRRELPGNPETPVKRYDVTVSVGLTPRVAWVANKTVRTEISRGVRPEIVGPNEREDVTGRFQTALNIGMFGNRGVVFPMSEVEIHDVTIRMNKLAEEEHHPSSAREIRDVARWLTKQFEKAKNSSAHGQKESPKFGITSVRSWFTKKN